MAEDFDIKIKELEQQLKALTHRMKEARTRWLEALAPQIAEFWMNCAEKAVTDQAAHATELGLDKIRSLKSEVQKLADDAHVVAQRRLEEENHKGWPDLAPQTEAYEQAFHASGPGSGFRLHDFYFEEPYTNRPVEGPDLLRSPVRQLAYEVDSVLESYGFETRGNRGDRAHSLLRWSWDQALAEPINEYADAHDEYVTALSELDRTHTQKAKSEARSLWDDA
jgi:hypothetical protein